MRYFTSVLLFLIFLLSNDNLAMGIDTDKCYSIDGPAHIRDTPNGKIVDSLPYGHGVRVKEVQAAWASIEYSRKSKFSCSSATDSISGWTHIKNLRPYAQTLEALVKDRKVLITAEKNLTFYDDERGELLGEKLIFKGDKHEREDMFGVAVPEHLKDLMTSVPKNISFCEKAQTERSFCKVYKGDFNKDGFVEILVNIGWYGAPWASKWEIFQIDRQGIKKELGKVGEDGGP